ncbi:septal ring lytic transglycosylase RlpA family protein [Alsobacter sp. KACC 23698]|uniref:Endolytic peptidoglycan transglycosylase RlpA n=1 Tax=Alsobacter sp. KACC 23698 TaxID=3149229 RepID=A0AAU7JJK9_9HYPH
MISSSSAALIFNLWRSALVLALTAAIAPLRAAAQEDMEIGGFDRFDMVRTVAPQFTRPDVQARLPASSLSSDDISPMSGAIATEPRAIPFDAPRRGLAASLKGLFIAPAEAATAQAKPKEAGDSIGSEIPIDNGPTTTGTLTLPLQPNLRAAGDSPFATTPKTTDAAVLSPAPQGRPFAHGRATWYQHPGRTASGEVYNPDGLTGAHPSLAFGSKIRVVNQDNGRSVVVRINDRTNERARAKSGFTIDLSRGAARALNINGVAHVALFRL